MSNLPLNGINLHRGCLTMCEACSPPRVPVYHGRSIILEAPPPCKCPCPSFKWAANGKRCDLCGHVLRILVEGLGENDWDFPLWLDAESKQPVRLDEVKD